MTDTAYTETGANDQNEDLAYEKWAAERKWSEPRPQEPVWNTLWFVKPTTQPERKAA